QPQGGTTLLVDADTGLVRYQIDKRPPPRPTRKKAPPPAPNVLPAGQTVAGPPPNERRLRVFAFDPTMGVALDPFSAPSWLMVAVFGLASRVSPVAGEPIPGPTVVLALGSVTDTIPATVPPSGGSHARPDPPRSSVRSAHSCGRHAAAIRWFGASPTPRHRLPRFADTTAPATGRPSTPPASGILTPRRDAAP